MVEVDALQFEVEPAALELLPMRLLRSQDLLALGVANDFLFVASWRPTDEDLLSHLRAVTGRPVMMVWSEREAIEARLDRLDGYAPAVSPEAQWRAKQHLPADKAPPAMPHAGPPQICTHPGQQLTHAKRLGQVVVGTGIQCSNFV